MMYNSFNEVKKMENGVLLQGFHWYIKPEEKLWKQLQEKVKSYKEMGFSAIWLPPAYKGVGGINDNGYGVYDLYDLGEFNQKGSIETKYGTKVDYLACIQAFQKAGIDVYGDIVLNHKMGADGTEIVNEKKSIVKILMKSFLVMNKLKSILFLLFLVEIKNILILFGIGIILMGLIMMKRPIVIPFSFLIKKVGIKKSMMKMAIMII